MKFRTRFFLLLLFLFLTFIHMSASELTVVTSQDIHPGLSHHRINNCLQMLARESKVDLHKLPNIVIFQVSKRAAKGAYITEEVAVRYNKASRAESGGYYEIWIVGDPKLKYVLALENVLEDYFQLKKSDEERDQLLRRVARIEDATVNAVEGK